MSKQLKGVGVWLIVLVLMIAGLSYLGEKLQTQNNYSYKELEEDLETVQHICGIAKRYVPECDVAEIVNRVQALHSTNGQENIV